MGTHSQIGCHRVKEEGGFFAEHGYLEVPLLVQWMATLRCGLRCEHCLAVSHESGFADMPFEKVRGLIDEISSMGVREFLVTGGEPLAREDLGEVIEHLGRRGVIWTLNTAAMPAKALRAAIERNKPGFVAVSVDGPRSVHDAFRGRAGAWEEAMEAIRFFKSLGTVRVCAGTTVTSRNYDCLDETFHLVAASEADQWGIHLLVPEGRAADRPDLFLSKAQLKRLIKLVARRRRQFHVQMADEIGYLGYLEPLVRDHPLKCGAGRAQCVVLPDGQVVPCTTLDRSCSAGSIHERPFREIWNEGFEDLRTWRPNGKCGRCDYSVACRGGCWLQRKAGTECFKDVWHVPGALKTAAGIAVCLGGLATSTQGALPPAASVVRAMDLCAVTVAEPWSLDEAVNAWYIEQATGTFLPGSIPSDAGNDAGWAFFLDFKQDAMPEDMSERCARVVGALGTRERSLSLISLLWRAVEGPIFQAGSTRDYSEAERLAIRDTLTALENKAQQWRQEVFEQCLDPYLAANRQTSPSSYPLPVSKAGGGGAVGYRYDTKYYLSKDLNEERWGAGPDPNSRETAAAYVRDHRYAEQMELVFTGSTPIRRYAAGGVVSVASESLSGLGLTRMGPFDLIETGGDVVARFTIRGDIRQSPPPTYDRDETSLLRDGIGEQDLSTTLSVQLHGGTQYTYVEMLNAVYVQHRLRLLPIAYDWLSANTVPMWSQDVPVITAVYENGALLWPAIWEIIQSDSIIRTGGQSGNGARVFSLAEIAEIHRRAVLKDIDFWMF